MPPHPTGAGFAPVSPVDIDGRGVAKRFGDTPIFSNVSVRLARGEAVALVGANGTGKLTLLRCFVGLIPTSKGRVTLLGQDTVAARTPQLRALRAQVDLVSQKAQSGAAPFGVVQLGTRAAWPATGLAPLVAFPCAATLACGSHDST
ncbi:MAG: ATP-binding cassette domain-containing protein [Pseudomonadota bacterium]